MHQRCCTRRSVEFESAVALRDETIQLASALNHALHLPALTRIAAEPLCFLLHLR